VHLDGYNQLPLLTGQQDKSARKEFFYINDDAELVAMRYENWKVVFCEQKVQGTLEIWAAPFVCRRVPKLFNLRLDPYERADVTSNTYYDWTIRRVFLLVPAQALVAQFIETFKDFPPRQKQASASIRFCGNDECARRLTRETPGRGKGLWCPHSFRAQEKPGAKRILPYGEVAPISILLPGP
jgi:hypothetical protein